MKIFLLIFYIFVFNVVNASELTLLRTLEEKELAKKNYVENNNWNWKKVFTKKGKSSISQTGVTTYLGTSYIDEASIRKIIYPSKIKVREFYNLINLAEPIGSSSSIIFQTKVNCKTKKFINDYIQFFSDPFGKGQSAMHRLFEPLSPRQNWVKGTRMYNLAIHACKTKPSETVNLQKRVEKFKKIK